MPLIRCCRYTKKLLWDKQKSELKKSPLYTLSVDMIICMIWPTLYGLTIVEISVVKILFWDIAIYWSMENQ